MFPLHRGVVNNKLRQSLLHFRVESFPTTFLFLDFLGVEPAENVLGMDVQLAGFGADDFGQALIRGQVQFANFLDQFALEFHCVALVSNGGFSLLVLSGSAAFGLDILL
jgi:hypothetical protein